MIIYGIVFTWQRNIPLINNFEEQIIYQNQCQISLKRKPFQNSKRKKKEHCQKHELLEYTKTRTAHQITDTEGLPSLHKFVSWSTNHGKVLHKL